MSSDQQQRQEAVQIIRQHLSNASTQANNFSKLSKEDREAKQQLVGSLKSLQSAIELVARHIA
jgi:hypothetical protein